MDAEGPKINEVQAPGTFSFRILMSEPRRSTRVSQTVAFLECQHLDLLARLASYGW